jgi:hypothetical protein
MATRVLLNRPSDCQGFVGIGLVAAMVLLNRLGGYQVLVGTSLMLAKVLFELAWWVPGSC